MHNNKKRFSAIAIATLLLVIPITVMSQEGSLLAPIGTCEECGDNADTEILNGTLTAISFKASMLQLVTGSGATIVQFNDDTILTGVDDFSAIRPGSSLVVEFLKENGVLLAVGIEATNKKPAVLSNSQVNARTLADLLSDKTAEVALIDARSSLSFEQEHIPGAISIYAGAFKKNIAKLPVKKDHLIVYYCDGTA